MIDPTSVYEQYVDRVYAYFAYRIGQTADAEDLTAVTFERVVRYAGRFDARKASIGTWVFTIAERVLIDHYRRGRHRTDVELPGDEAIAAAGLAYDGAFPHGGDPQLHEALQQLSDRERQVIGLRFGGDLSGREIAGILQVSEANVHQILSRSLRKLRKLLDAPTPAA